MIHESSEALATVDVGCTPRDVLAVVMAMRPRRFHLVGANAAAVTLRLSSTTSAGFEQGLEVRMRPVPGGTRVSVEYAGTLRARGGADVCHSFLADLRRGLGHRASAEPIPA